jgi:hypothetical protein
MMRKSRYIQYDKRMAYLHKPQGLQLARNKYHNRTIENFHIKKYTSHSHGYYISTCCLVVAFECFVYCANGLFIALDYQIKAERNILIQSHYFTVLPLFVMWGWQTVLFFNTLHSSLRLMADFVRGICSDSPHSVCKISHRICMLNQKPVFWSSSWNVCFNLCEVLLGFSDVSEYSINCIDH